MPEHQFPENSSDELASIDAMSSPRPFGISQMSIGFQNESLMGILLGALFRELNKGFLRHLEKSWDILSSNYGNSEGWKCD